MNDYKLGHAGLQETAASKTQTRAHREDGRGIVSAPTNRRYWKLRRGARGLRCLSWLRGVGAKYLVPPFLAV